MNLKNALAVVPQEFQDIYQRNWHAITGSKTGLIKDVIHFPLVTETNEEIEQHIRRTIDKYSSSVKVNVSFGYILK